VNDGPTDGTARDDLRFLTSAPREPPAIGGLPAWFTGAVGTAHTDHVVDLAGTTITYRAWGKVGAPLVVLVHGGGAHAGWWSHIAPLLAADYRVVAPDLSGHGDSSWRPTYTFEAWSDEVLAVVERESTSRAILIGHSMGGAVSLVAGHRFGESVSAVVAIDTLVERIPATVRAWVDAGTPLPSHRRYADLDVAIGRFRAHPADIATIDYVNRHVAAESLRRVDDTWTWKFDPDVYYFARSEPELLGPVACPVVLISGERGLATAAVIAHTIERVGGRPVHVVIPDAGHHILLEQPVALVATLRTLLASWD
jgi:pimeloyl-ACP methyl ester carboxylesterase